MRKEKSKGAFVQSKRENGQSTDDPNTPLFELVNTLMSGIRGHGTSRALVCFGMDGLPSHGTVRAIDHVI